MLLLLLVGALATGASAETRNVSWRTGMRRDEQYVEAAPGDSIRFNWGYGHNVYIMDSCSASQWSDFQCPSSSNGSRNLGSSSPVTYTIPENASGYLCFWCQRGSHCRYGQHMTVKIAAANNNMGSPSPVVSVVNNNMGSPSPVVSVVNNNNMGSPSPVVSVVDPIPQPQPVGGNGEPPIRIDWKLGMGEETQNVKVLKPGQELIFSWSGGHNVLLMDDCDGEGDQLWSDFQCPDDESKSTNLGGASPVSYIVPENAPKYLCFWCSISGHCGAGQHSTVKVKFADDEKPLLAPISVDWKIGMGALGKSIPAKPGQELVFNFGVGHNVLMMKECDGAGDQLWSDFTCPSSEDGSVNLGEASPVRYKVPEENPPAYLCFWCSIGGHCSAGQHSTIKIKGVGNGDKINDNNKELKKSKKARRKADRKARRAARRARRDRRTRRERRRRRRRN